MIQHASDSQNPLAGPGPGPHVRVRLIETRVALAQDTFKLAWFFFQTYPSGITVKAASVVPRSRWHPMIIKVMAGTLGRLDPRRPRDSLESESPSRNVTVSDMTPRAALGPGPYRKSQGHSFGETRAT